MMEIKNTRRQVSDGKERTGDENKGIFIIHK